MIKKTSETTPTMASIVDGYSTSTQDGYSCNYINEHESIYSTNEQVIGTWINGKPLYRKTIYDTTGISANTNKIIDTNTPNIGIITKIDAILSSSDKTTYRNINMYNLEATNISTSMYMKTNGIITIRSNDSWGSPNIIVSFEYTKTTD